MMMMTILKTLYHVHNGMLFSLLFFFFFATIELILLYYNLSLGDHASTLKNPVISNKGVVVQTEIIPQSPRPSPTTSSSTNTEPVPSTSCEENNGPADMTVDDQDDHGNVHGITLQDVKSAFQRRMRVVSLRNTGNHLDLKIFLSSCNRYFVETIRICPRFSNCLVV